MKLFSQSLVAVFLLSGCLSSPRHVAVSPSVEIAPSGVISLKGDSPTPAKVNTSDAQTKIPIPDGSRIEFNEKLGTMAITLSKASEMVLNRKETAIQGPVAFTPDEAPTIKDEKDAQSEFWVKLGLYTAVFIGAGGAIFGLVRGWNFVMYGGVATLAGGLFGLFVERHPLILLLIGFGIALKVAGPVIWHTTIKKTQT